MSRFEERVGRKHDSRAGHDEVCASTKRVVGDTQDTADRDLSRGEEDSAEEETEDEAEALSGGYAYA